MEILDNIKQWLQPIISSGNYSIISLDYNAGCFGNIYVLLKSEIGTNIQIVRDRDIMSCNVGLKTNPLSDWIPIEYALEYYEFNCFEHPKAVEEYFDFICKLIIEKEDILVKLKKPIEFHKMEKWVLQINQKRLFREDI